MATLTVIGVRHHSPACARLVADVITEHRPRFVLIEGPCDMNDRLGELLLEHRLPIAIYTYRLGDDAGRARGSWSPFCEYSPEWVALERGRAVGAEVLFVDLPAWDDAFAETENRYSDAHLNVSSRLREIAERLGFDSTDTLWDHLFEQPKDSATLERELARYFDALRADEHPGQRDVPREAWMARWIAWAMAQAAEDESVVVVCGGYHKPALERLWFDAQTSRPELTMPSDRVGSYLVPFSFRRLDSFAGYASGMPCPAFYQETWERGADAVDTMLFRVVERLRSKGQRVSSAHVLAVSELTRGLARLRGHEVPARTDLLDGLLGGLLKDALTAPPPWTIRGTLPKGTDPILVEIVSAFSGDARGTLDPKTPRPPLLEDIEREMARHELAWTEKSARVKLDSLDRLLVARRQTLHRLAILEIPGIELVAAPDLRRGATQPFEEWRLERTLESEPTMIERAVYGATLEQAAGNRILENIQAADGAARLLTLVRQALFAGFDVMASDLVDRARTAMDREPEFANVGDALAILLSIVRVTNEERRDALAPLLGAAAERAGWLLEGLDGAHAPLSRRDVYGVAALRDAVRDDDLVPIVVRRSIVELFERRSVSADAPPAIRGASLGALWSLQDPDAPVDASVATNALTAVANAGLGDFLSGLFATAREEFLASPLLDVVDERLAALDETDFLAALPSVRMAFSFFPPRERLAIAKRLVRAGRSDVAPEALLRPSMSAETVQRGAALEAEVLRIAKRFHLLGADS